MPSPTTGTSQTSNADRDGSRSLPTWNAWRVSRAASRSSGSRWGNRRRPSRRYPPATTENLNANTSSSALRGGSSPQAASSMRTGGRSPCRSPTASRGPASSWPSWLRRTRPPQRLRRSPCRRARTCGPRPRFQRAGHLHREEHDAGGNTRDHDPDEKPRRTREERDRPARQPGQRQPQHRQDGRAAADYAARHRAEPQCAQDRPYQPAARTPPPRGGVVAPQLIPPLQPPPGVGPKEHAHQDPPGDVPHGGGKAPLRRIVLPRGDEPEHRRIPEELDLSSRGRFAGSKPRRYVV